jgi:hypothetical protein
MAPDTPPIPPGAEHRAHRRADVLVAGRLLCGGQWRPCEVVNISAGGARLRAAGDFCAGAELCLDIEACGQFAASVAWARGGELGLRFSADPAEVALALIGLATYG